MQCLEFDLADLTGRTDFDEGFVPLEIGGEWKVDMLTAMAILVRTSLPRGGKLGSCVERTDCAGDNCLVCQSQH